MVGFVSTLFQIILIVEAVVYGPVCISIVPSSIVGSYKVTPPLLIITF